MATDGAAGCTSSDGGGWSQSAATGLPAAVHRLQRASITVSHPLPALDKLHGHQLARGAVLHQLGHAVGAMPQLPHLQQSMACMLSAMQALQRRKEALRRVEVAALCQAASRRAPCVPRAYQLKLRSNVHEREGRRHHAFTQYCSCDGGLEALCGAQRGGQGTGMRCAEEAGGRRRPSASISEGAPGVAQRAQRRIAIDGRHDSEGGTSSVEHCRVEQF